MRFGSPLPPVVLVVALLTTAARSMNGQVPGARPPGGPPETSRSGLRDRVAGGPLQSGPMVGYAEMREVMLWVQTREPARVEAVYWDTAAPGIRYRSRMVRTVAESAHVAHLLADRVQPGRRYAYEIVVDGRTVRRPYPLRFQSLPLWQWRGDPPPIRIALGSCAFVNDSAYDRPGDGYGGNYEIFTSIARHKPDLMLWLGDNTYLREPDWYTRTGVFHRYTHTRSLPDLQPLLGSTHHYAIWDDHDYGPNNSDRSWARRDLSLAAFKLFWANLSYGAAGEPGATGSFEWGDVQFFLLDDRYHRSPNDRRETTTRTLLGARQLEWLVDALASSTATFKIVALGNQAMSPNAVFENFATYPEERRLLIDRITAEKISGVLFVSGDRHITELTRLERPGTYPLYDWTVSPLTAGPAKGEANASRVEGTFVVERNFGILEVRGKRKERVLTLTTHGTDGRVLWTREIREGELR